MPTREHMMLVAIDQPLCVHEWGDALLSTSGGCPAALGADGTRKCFNTKATCPVQEAYLPETLTLLFSRPQLDVARHYGYVIPSIDSLSTSPGSINLGGMDGSQQAMGRREIVTIQFSNHKHDDHLVDKYRLERATGAASIVHSGTAIGGSPASDNSSSLELASDAADGEYDDMILRLVSGAGSVQERRIESYVDGVATVETPWSVNALTRSSEIDHANWTKQNGITITANYDVAPDGTTKAERVQTDGVSLARYFQTVTGYNGKTVCFALKMRSLTGGNQSIQVHLRETGFGTSYATQSKTVTPTWETFSITAAIPGGSAGVMALVYDSSGVVMYDIAVCDHQFHEGAEPLEFIETGASPVALPDTSTEYEVASDYDPYDSGTFWGKWLARNPFHVGYPVRVYEGVVGDALEDMRVRHYVIDRIEGPSNGKVKIVAKDTFALVEARKAVAPVASRGELLAAITGSPATFNVSPVGIGNEDYTSSGYVAIGDEIIQYTRAGDVFTVVQRGALNTEAEDHDEEDLVQQVLTYTTMRSHNIVFDLLCRFTVLGNVGSPTGSDFIDKTVWDERAVDMSDLFTARIAEPTPVLELIGELAEQSGFTVHPNVSTGMIDFVPLRAATVSPRLTDNEWLVEGSISTKRDDSKRTSRVSVYYGQINPMEALDDRRNYHSRLITVDPDAEDETEYGAPAIREVFSRWIPQFGRQAAESCGERIQTMFRDPPLEARFAVRTSRADELSLARYFYLETGEVEDPVGDPDSMLAMAPIEIDRGPDETRIRAQQVRFGEVEPEESPTVLTRRIYIENDAYNLDIRQIHDSLFEAPIGGETIEVYVLPGITVGSTSVNVAALKTGLWPDGVNLYLINEGRIQGKGGNGGSANGGTLPANGANGQNGGPALQAEYPITVDNTNGEIWGGGGGGGAGGSACFEFDPGDFVFISGGGAGAGAGTDPATGGAVGLTNFGRELVIATSGSNSTTEAAGSAGVGGNDGFGDVGGNGGNGGGPGLAGSSAGNGFSGSVSSISGSPYDGVGGSGGAAGNYIVGNAFVTWDGNGDRRGGVA